MKNQTTKQIPKMTLKECERIFILVLLLIACFSIRAALVTPDMLNLSLEKWLSIAGLVFTLAGFVQMDHAGFFDGTTTWINYKILDEAQGNSVRTILFFNGRFGFFIVIIGTIFQLMAVFA
jgi:hypothetical protein